MLCIGKTQKTSTAGYFIDNIYDVINSCYFIRNLAVFGLELGHRGIILNLDSYFSIFSITAFVLLLSLAFFLK